MCDLGPDPLDGGARPRPLVPLLFHSAVSVLQVRFMIRKVAGGGWGEGGGEVTHFSLRRRLKRKCVHAGSACPDCLTHGKAAGGAVGILSLTRLYDGG